MTYLPEFLVAATGVIILVTSLSALFFVMTSL